MSTIPSGMLIPCSGHTAYVWLEGPLFASEEKRAWISDQIRDTEDFLTNSGVAKMIEADVRTGVQYEKVCEATFNERWA